MADDDKTFTQADLERQIGERLARERAKFADYDEVKRKLAEYEATTGKDKSDLEKLTQQVQTLTTSLAKSEKDRTRMEVATAKGLTPAQAKRLQGDTKEQLENDADDLLASFPAPPPKKEGEGEGEEQEQSTSTTSTTSTTQPHTRRPIDQLTAGGAPVTTGAPEETNPEKLADLLGR